MSATARSSLPSASAVATSSAARSSAFAAFSAVRASNRDSSSRAASSSRTTSDASAAERSTSAACDARASATRCEGPSTRSRVGERALRRVEAAFRLVLATAIAALAARASDSLPFSRSISSMAVRRPSPARRSCARAARFVRATARPAPRTRRWPSISCSSAPRRSMASDVSCDGARWPGPAPRPGRSRGHARLDRARSSLISPWSRECRARPGARRRRPGGRRAPGRRRSWRLARRSHVHRDGRVE